jgi:hypothetical protein
MFSFETNKKRILRTTIFTLFIALGSFAGFFMLIFEGMPFWEQTIAPAFNFAVNDLFGDVIRNSGIIGGILFAFSYLLFNGYFLFFPVAGTAVGYLAAKICLRILNND